MQVKANQISAATVEILDEASAILASTPAAPREAAACEVWLGEPRLAKPRG